MHFIQLRSWPWKKTMEKLVLYLGLVLLSISNPSCRNSQTTFPVLKGPYLGQRTPGNTPEFFAPGIISTGLYARDMALSKDGKEIYFCVSDGGLSAIFVTTLMNTH